MDVHHVSAAHAQRSLKRASDSLELDPGLCKSNTITGRKWILRGDYIFKIFAKTIHIQIQEFSNSQIKQIQGKLQTP